MNRKGFLRTAGLALGAGMAGGAAMVGGCRGGDARDGRTTGDGDAAGADGSARQGDMAGQTDAGARPVQGLPLGRVGVQLYTVRSLMAEDVAATLDAVAEIGYQEVEFAGYFGHDAATIQGWLDASGLSAPAAHLGLEEMEGPRLEASLEAATRLGHRWLVLPWIAEELRTPDGYRSVADRLNAAGEIAGAAGIRVAYHNHDFEFEPLVGPATPFGEAADEPPATAAAPRAAAAAGLQGTGFAILADRLDPAVADLEIDLHWSAAVGVDPFELFGAHPGRFALSHLKDIDLEGRMLAVGQGDIDWPSILARSEEAGLRHHFVEHDNPADPLASIRASHDYLTGQEPR